MAVLSIVSPLFSTTPAHRRLPDYRCIKEHDLMSGPFTISSAPVCGSDAKALIARLDAELNERYPDVPLDHLVLTAALCRPAQAGPRFRSGDADVRSAGRAPRQSRAPSAGRT